MWLKELNLLSRDVTQRIEPLFEYDSKNWIFVRYIRLKVKESNLFFSIRLNESNTFFFCMWLMFSFDLKNWFFFCKKFSKNWFFVWLKEWYLTQRLEVYVFEIWFKELDFFFFWWLADLNFFKNYDAKIFFEKYDSKNWTFFVLKKWLKELNLFVWLKESNPFFNVTRKNWTSVLSMIQRIESLSEYDSKNRTLFFFWIRLNESIPFFECDSIEILVEK